MNRLTGEMFCLMEGRHVHPSTLYPGGVGTVPTVQLFTDYIVRLMKYVEFMKKVLPLHDDLFDFFYDALPGYEEVGRRRILLGCWGSFNNPEHCDYTSADHLQGWQNIAKFPAAGRANRVPIRCTPDENSFTLTRTGNGQTMAPLSGSSKFRLRSILKKRFRLKSLH
jgi:hypothetical protein